MATTSHESSQLPYRVSWVEFLVHLGAAGLLLMEFWSVVPKKELMVYFGSILTINTYRIIALGFASYSSKSRPDGSSWLALLPLSLGTALAGIAWGGVPVFAALNAAVTPDSQAYITWAISVILIASLAESISRSWLFKIFALPTVGIPLAYSVWIQDWGQTSVWAFLLLVVLLVSRTNSQFSRMVGRYRQLSRGNTELLKNLTDARDAAVKNQKAAERANTAIQTEIEERMRAEEKIRESEQELSAILNDMQDTFFRTDKEGIITRVSPSIQYLLGYTPAEVIGQPYAMLFVDQAAHRKFLTALDAKFGMVENLEVRLQHHMGDDVWASVNAHFYNDAQGNSSGIEGTIRDVTENKRAAEALFREKDRLHVTLESIGDGVVTTDVNNIVEYINPRGEEMTGWTTEEARGQSLSTVMQLVDEDNSDPVQLPTEKWLQEGQRAALANPAMLVQRQTQSESAIELTGAPIRNSKESVIGAVLVFRDVTKLRSLAKQLSYQATHDALTGLINRIEFDKRVEQAILSASRSDKIHALCYLDLDNFKVVNDTCGHHAGDELLKQLTTLLRDNLRESDTLARLGGDEFGVLFTGCPLEKAAELAENLRRQVEEFRFVWEGKAFRVGLSIGVVPISRDTASLTELLSAADSACYVAKERGRNYVHVYQPDDAAVAEHHGQMQWMQRIQRALDLDLFELHLQSIVAVDDPDPDYTHGEILVRMLDDKKPEGKNIIPPNAFIPAAERYHLMPQIDRWVVRATLVALAENASTQPLTTCGINLSGQSLSDLKLLDYILGALKETGISPEVLCFEITESAVIANLDVAKEFITRLKNIGCRFALDDFGSGLSSFAYLKNLPVDYVKLDGSMVLDVAGSRVSQAMVHAINYVTHVMGMKSIAEYVESQAILESLKAISVDYAQGFGIAKPKPFYRPAVKQAKVAGL